MSWCKPLRDDLSPEVPDFLIDHRSPAMSMAMPWERQDPLTQALYRVRMRGAFYSWTVASGLGRRGDAADRRHPELPHRRARLRVHRGRRRRGGPALAPDTWRWCPGASGIVGHRNPLRPSWVGADELPQTMLGDSFLDLSAGGIPTTRSAWRCCAAWSRSTLPPSTTSSPSFHRSSRVDSARHPTMAALLGAARGRAARPAARRRRSGNPTRRRARDPDGARLALGRAGGCRRMVGCCPARPSTGPGRRSSAPRPGAWLDARPAGPHGPRCRAPHSLRDSPRSRECRPDRGPLAHAQSPGDAPRRIVGKPPWPQALGYGSEAAFSRAFARITGQTPGRVRRSAA